MLDTLRDIVRQHELQKPRAQQTEIGPSEAGTPCSRKLAYKLLGTPASNPPSDPWAAIIGTSVHAYLDEVFKGNDRWITDKHVTLPGYMGGTLDLYDTETKTVIDHKVVGKTSMDRFKRDGISAQYETQVHLYAAGLIVEGYEVENVAVVFWSRTGALRDAQYWQAPYDEKKVEAALARLDAIKYLTDTQGADALPLIPATESHCYFCSYYLPGATDVKENCPGVTQQPNTTHKRKTTA